MELEKHIKALSISGGRRIAVAAAQDDAVLGAAIQAHHMGIATPILFGDIPAIQALAQRDGLDIAPFEQVQAEDPKQAARLAIAHIRAGRADMLMKGGLQTADFLRAVLNRDEGLRLPGLLSHVSVLQVPALRRPLLLTDAALVPYPDVGAKAALIRNAVAVAHCLGIATPKVAALAAVEVVNPDMPATLDAAALAAMNRRGQIKGCVVDGPLAMDLAVSAEAAAHKGVQSPVAGCADILLFHNIEAGNSVLKTLTHLAGSLFGGLVMGAAAPVVLPSRSDSIENKLYSIACAAAVCQNS